MGSEQSSQNEKSNSYLNQSNQQGQYQGGMMYHQYSQPQPQPQPQQQKFQQQLQQQQQQQQQQTPQQIYNPPYAQHYGQTNLPTFPSYSIQAQSPQQQTHLQEQQKRLSQYGQLQYPSMQQLNVQASNSSAVNNNLSISSQHLNNLVNTTNTVPKTLNSNANHTYPQPSAPFITVSDFSLNEFKIEDPIKNQPFPNTNGLSRPHSETNMFPRKSNSTYDINTQQPAQKLLVLRHGERVDTTFGPTWVDNCFDSNGRYTRFNLNMPKTLPHRDNAKYEYIFDPPLTEMGLHQAKLTGEELLSQGITISHCYSSPALRSIQTADSILEGMNLKNTVPIKIEIGLFEFLRWQINKPSKYPFMTIRNLVATGYNIDLNYTPIFQYDMLRFDENEEAYYQRSYFMTRTITDRHNFDGGNIMFVGHAPTIEVCTRQLCGESPRVNEFRQIVRKVPFLAIAQCEKNPVTQQWKLKKPPIPTLKHLAVDEFDWKNLQNNNFNNANPINDTSPYFQQYQANNIPKVQQIPVVNRPYVPWRV